MTNGIAIISAVASIVAAGVSAFFAWRSNKVNKQYQDKWAFIIKKTALFDGAIEACCRMLWNKLLIADNLEVEQAKSNLFILQKDCLVIETQLLLYGNKDLADAVASFKQKIIETPDNEINQKWSEIIEEGRKQIYELKKDLGCSVTEKYKALTKKLTLPPTSGISSQDAIKKISQI